MGTRPVDSLKLKIGTSNLLWRAYDERMRTTFQPRMQRMRKYSVLTRFILLIIAGIMSASWHSVGAAPRSCEGLAQLVLPNTKITTAQTIPAGEFTPPGRTAIKDLP